MPWRGVALPPRGEGGLLLHVHVYIGEGITRLKGLPIQEVMTSQQRRRLDLLNGINKQGKQLNINQQEGMVFR